MKNFKKISIYFLLFVFFSSVIFSCKKDTPIVKKYDPVFNWDVPADIIVGTALSATQLNATANVPGAFVYVPDVAVKLALSDNQDLTVTFTPTDLTRYNVLTKTVKINVKPEPTVGSVTDADGNVYKTVRIGTQTWMAENLKTSKLKDNTAITLISGNNAWEGTTGANTPAFCYYNDDVANKATYGVFYNQYVIQTGKLAPTGWHVPTQAEWDVLVAYVGGLTVGGGKLKEIGTSHWTTNVGATNDFGFAVLPSGARNYNVLECDGQGIYTAFWTATAWGAGSAISGGVMNFNGSTTEIKSEAQTGNTGMPVRCIKDSK